jgi:LysM repeat protein
VPKKAATEVVHRVKKGENLHIIAEKYGTNVTSIVRRNALNPRKPLYVDLRLKIPSPAGEGGEEPQPRVSSNGKRAEADNRQSDEKGQREEKVAVRFHTVRQGETLGRIAAKNKVSLGTLLRWNDMKPGERLIAGRQIKIPQMPRYYVVKKGDSLEKIARKHHTTVTDLRKRNGTQKLSPLYVNQRLVVSDR